MVDKKSYEELFGSKNRPIGADDYKIKANESLDEITNKVSEAKNLINNNEPIEDDKVDSWYCKTDELLAKVRNAWRNFNEDTIIKRANNDH